MHFPCFSSVDFNKMFGCPCYIANEKMFTGMVTKRIIITELTSLERDELNKLRATKPFVAGEKIFRSFVSVELDPKNIKEIMPYVKKAMKEQ